ncbi:hypothetical protein SAMN05216367_4770 [Tardiphaga sp. OK245]|nr:hypothetical protein SAMN05216367_4770 [Tardiphaga sp. OK245]
MAQISSAPDLSGYVFGHVVRPMLKGIEGNDPLWIIILTGHQVFDDGSGSVRLAPRTSRPLEAV